MSRFGRIVLVVLASAATTVAVAPPASAATYYNLFNYKSAQCMSVENSGSTANGANIIQWSCGDGSE
ncbi:MAG: hypothetical protein ABIQ18_47415, partial [Umezawaea sp.]